MPVSITFTHKGWAGPCPVYATHPESPDVPGPEGFVVVARRSWLEWLLTATEFVWWLLCLGDDRPMPLRLTPLDKPLVQVHRDAD